ncbi:MAG: IS256 family transposase [Deltaproteobacteria bacterium]|nr:MAG: IS256 family transposase [Deltaproteobacteria bacterium]
MRLEGPSHHPIIGLVDRLTRNEGDTMATKKMDALAVLGKRQADGGDMMRQMVQEFAERLMSSEVDALCGASLGERSDERVNQRNGYREREWDTRAGTLALQIPKIRQGSYFPEWLLGPRRRAERALCEVVVECYVRGVSTRRVDGLVKTMGMEGMSKSQVSRLAEDLDEMVESFRNRPLDQGPYTYVWVDALVHKCREGGRIVNVATVIATGVNHVGAREILGVDVFTSEDGAAWVAFLRHLVARGLSGLKLVISDCHQGLKNAIAAVVAGAGWQRCRTHFVRNLLGRVPKASQQMVATLMRSVFMQPDLRAVHEQHRRVVEQLQASGFTKAAALLVDAAEEVLAFGSFSKEHWKQICSNNPQERLNKEVRRHTDVVGIFPNRGTILQYSQRCQRVLRLGLGKFSCESFPFLSC